ncbi:acetyltransferase [Bacillus taeanensis]|uniref:Acetyltransferase n=1 Tax=Bacillus taeanensis TaxID=273032 RepID=A0A366Y342_9BACI|nr:acetyltransferase [Bacillus taeanensis]
MWFVNLLKGHRTPIIVVPGLFGSMSNEIIPGTGSWSFGIAKYAYEPFINMLEEMGYVQNKDLFIAFYDWRKQIPHSAKDYLYMKIKEVKRKTKAKKVHLICHSMGGLVARAYVQSDYYENDVQQLIILATPNAGSTPNYSYWTGGKMPGHGHHFNAVHLYMEVYLWLLGKLYKGNQIEAIHKHFKGLKDIMPGKDYGSYLINENKNGTMSFLSYEKMKTKNPFIDSLNDNRILIEKRGIKVTLIAGIGEETVQYLEVIPSDSKTKWADGQVVGEIKTDAGDGNASLNSVFLINGDKYMLRGSHIEILTESEPILRKKLLGKGLSNHKKTAKTKEEKDEIMILTEGKGDFYISEDKEYKHVKKGMNFTCGNIHYEQFSDTLSCLLISGKDLNNIRLKYRAKSERPVEIIMKQKGMQGKSLQNNMSAENEIEII